MHKKSKHKKCWELFLFLNPNYSIAEYWQFHLNFKSAVCLLIAILNGENVDFLIGGSGQQTKNRKWGLEK